MKNNLHQHYEICICGGGIAGLLLAYCLGRQGVRVLIIEKNAAINSNGADVLKPSGIEVFEKLGLLDDLLKAEARVRQQVRIFHDGELIQEMDYRKEHERSFFLLVPYKVVLSVLLSKIEELQHVTLLMNTALTGMEKDSQGAVTKITLNHFLSLSCDVLVGADGVKSTVREMMDMPVEVEYYAQAMYFNQFPMVPSVDACNRLYVDSKYGLAYFYPINHREFRCVLGFAPDEGTRLLHKEADIALLQNRLKQFVTESDDALAAINQLSGFVTFPLCKMHLPQYYKQNAVLLGNAAHAIHPITGQGMNLAIEDAGVLYPLLQSYFDGWISLEEALQHFNEERKFINGQLLEYGHRLANSFHARDEFKHCLNLKLQTSNRQQAVLEAI